MAGMPRLAHASGDESYAGSIRAGAQVRLAAVERTRRGAGAAPEAEEEALLAEWYEPGVPGEEDEAAEAAAEGVGAVIEPLTFEIGLVMKLTEVQFDTALGALGGDRESTVSDVSDIPDVTCIDTFRDLTIDGAATPPMLQGKFMKWLRKTRELAGGGAMMNAGPAPPPQ